MMIWILICIIIMCIVSMIPIEKFQQQMSITVVVSHYNEDLEWLKKCKYPIVLCDKLGSQPSHLTPDESCSLSVNHGREASSYLNYIINNYDSLSEYTVFLHGHENANHQKLPFGILNGIDQANISNYDFISLNNMIHVRPLNHKSPPKDEFGNHSENHTQVTNLIKYYWPNVFQPVLGDIPYFIRYDCCAQFIVSRKAIRRHSKAVYETFFNCIMNETDSWAIGVVFEILWQMIFTGITDICEVNGLKNICTNDSYVNIFYT